MRCLTTWTALLFTFALLLVVSAGAEPPGVGQFDRFDRNHDGKLSPDEMPSFADFDVDHDGLVSRQEAESFFRPGGPGGRFDRGGPRGGPGDPIQQSTLWIDPVTTAPRGMTYHLFDTNARGKGTRGSYLIYLPPSYNKETTRRYPVIYWLHGGNNTARQGGGGGHG